MKGKGEMNQGPKLFAGLDVDGDVKLFVLDGNGQPARISHLKWLKILEALPFTVEPGEMLVVSLKKDDEAHA